MSGQAWDEASLGATGRVGEKGEHFEQPISPRMHNQDKERSSVSRMTNNA